MLPSMNITLRMTETKYIALVNYSPAKIYRVVCGWSERDNEINTQMVPERDHKYWMKLWQCLAYFLSAI